MAQEICQQTGIDTLRIEAEEPYSGTFDETIARCQKEMADSVLPKLLALDKDIAAYDTIFLGYPIWFGTYAPPVASLIKSGALDVKVIIRRRGSDASRLLCPAARRRRGESCLRQGVWRLSHAHWHYRQRWQAHRWRHY
ncbi:MAG: flavodoxin [Prevotella sp.]